MVEGGADTPFNRLDLLAAPLARKIATIPCTHCEGTGRHITENNVCRPCKACRGRGKVAEKERKICGVKIGESPNYSGGMPFSIVCHNAHSCQLPHNKP
jgi:hypothetical protein